MVSTNIRKNPDRTEKLGITLPISLLHKIDNNRGDIPRSKYIRRVIERYLKWNNGMHICWKWSLLFVTITIMIHVVANSTNTTTLPERRSWSRVLVHVITRKKDDLRWHRCSKKFHSWHGDLVNTRIFVTYGCSMPLMYYSKIWI